MNEIDNIGLGSLIGGKFGNALTRLGEKARRTDPTYVTSRTAEDRTRLMEEESMKKTMLLDGRKALLLGSQGDWGGAQTLLQNRLDMLTRLGRNSAGTADLLRKVQSGDHEGALVELKSADDMAVLVGELPAFGGDSAKTSASTRNYVNGLQMGIDNQRGPWMIDTRGMPVSPGTPEWERNLQEAVEAEIEHQRDRSHARGTGAGEAKGETEFKWAPQIAAAKEEAVLTVRNALESEGKAKDNATVLEAYDAAMGQLATSLGATVTGPVAGWLPALTSNQQMAKGAVATMAPVLKQIFRSAGEGSFTDSDQKLLMDMVPTRTDSPAARVGKIQMIDTIVRAKLGQPARDTTLPPYNEKGWKLMTDKNGARAYVSPDRKEVQEVR